MEENTQEKNLIEKEERNLFGKIKNFFKKIFFKNVTKEEHQEESVKEEVTNEFKESIKMSENEEKTLLELQARYRRGEISENDLTEEQIDALCDLYDRQIDELNESIRIKEEKIAEYKRRIENNNA